MTRTARIVGGILAIAGGALMIIVITTLLKIGEINRLAFVINPICGGLALIGGICLIKDRAVGSILALIGSIIFVILSFIPDPAGGFLTQSYFNHFFYIDAILAIVGAIIGLAVGSEFQAQ